MAAKKKAAKKKATVATPVPPTPKPALIRTDQIQFDENGLPLIESNIIVQIEGSEEFRQVYLNQLTAQVKIRAALDGIFAKIRKAKEPFVLLDQMLAGTWPEGRKSPGSGGRVPMAVEALQRVTGKTLDECKAVWAAKDDVGKKAIQGDARIRQMIIQIREERSGRTASGLDELFKEPPAPVGGQEVPATAPPAPLPAPTAPPTAPVVPQVPQTAPEAAGRGAPPGTVAPAGAPAAPVAPGAVPAPAPPTDDFG